jgi:hypothetical protein
LGATRVVFVVNDAPYCVWDEDILERSRAFLRSLDPDYFAYATETHGQTDDDKRASVALRLTLHHAMETLFSLLGAYVQAPFCPYAWLFKCSTGDLRKVVQRLNAGDPTLYTALRVTGATWSDVSRSIHATDQPGTERQTKIIEEFATFWRRLATEFLSRDHIDEYNAIKHGFRFGSGGFTLAFAEETSPGVAPPEAAFRTLGSSAHGASFYRVVPLTKQPKDRSLVVEHQAVNWSIERVMLLNQLVYMSINNVVSALRIANGASPGKNKFMAPVHEADFLRPWKYSPGVTSSTFRRGVPASACALTTKELLKTLERLKSAP